MSATVPIDGDGWAVVALPAAAGTLANPPALTCYISEVADGPFILVSNDSYADLTCGLTHNAGILYVWIGKAPPGWTAKFVLVY